MEGLLITDIMINYIRTLLGAIDVNTLDPSLLDDSFHFQLGLDDLLFGHDEVRHQPLVDLPEEDEVALQIAHNQHLDQHHIDDDLE